MTNVTKAAQRKMKTAWKALRRDPELAHRASVRLAAARFLPCKTVDDPEIFFPPPGGASGVVASTLKAKKLCSHCPYYAQLDCLAVALTALPGQQHGISAGTTPKTRSTFIYRERNVEQAMAE